MAESETKTWKEVVLKEQQLYYEMLGDRDWDCFKESEMEFLLRNVGHAMYGPPEQLPDEKENRNTGYNADKLEVIQKVICAIKEHCKCPPYYDKNDVWISTVFVCLYIEERSVPVPVFRIPHHEPQVKNKSNCWFVDTNCRVYEDWESYLKNNCLPKCTYCYPVNGIYNGDESDNVLVEFGETPASSITNQICNVLDTASTVVTIGGMGVTVAAMFATVAAPLVVASTVGTIATGMYGVGRSTVALVDRGKHKQSVGLEDAESRSCWLSVAGNSLGIAAGQAMRSITKMTQQGKVLSSAGRLLVNAINFSSLTVNGLGLINNMVMLQEKAKKNELRPLDVFQFASSVLFFTMSAVNIKTADNIIRETQNGMIGDYEASLRSNRHRRQFRRLMKETQGEDGNSMQGNARVIRGITQISDKDNFFAGLVRVRKQFAQNKAKVVLTDTGLVEINGKLRLHPMKFWEIDKIQREFILDATKNLNQGTWSQERYNQEMQSVHQEHNLLKNSQQTGTDAGMETSGLPDVILNRLSFSHRLFQFAREHRAKILNIAKNLAEMMGFHKTAEVIKVADFLANYVEQVVAGVETKYQEDLTAAQNAQGESFNRENFDTEYNIQGNRQDHFIRVVLTNYNTYEALVYLKTAYYNLTNVNQTPSDTPGTSQPNLEAANLTEHVKHFAKQHRKKIICIAINLCNILGLRSTPELISVTNFVANYIENVLSEMEIKYEQSLNETMEHEGKNFRRQEFDKKYNIDGERREHFLKNIINNYNDYEQLKKLKTSYEENLSQTSAEENLSQTSAEENLSQTSAEENLSQTSDEISSQSKDEPEPTLSEDDCIYREERNFKLKGNLSDEELYKIAETVTGLYLFEGNAALRRDGPLSFVTINDTHIESATVMIYSNTDSNVVTATLII